MKCFILLLHVGFVVSTATAQYKYPHSKTVDTADKYWGVTVNDPYRWIENLNDSNVLNWFNEQSSYTNTALKKIPNQDLLVKELKALDTIAAATMEPVAKSADKYFYRKRLNGESAVKLFYRQGENGEEILLFDPQNFIKGKTVDYLPRISDDGSKVLLIISETGGDLGDIHIMDVVTKQFYPDVIPHARGRFVGGSNTNIVYLEYASNDPHNKNNILNCPFKLHVMGTPISEDILLANTENYPELNLAPVERPWVTIYQHSPFIICEKNSGGDVPLFYALKSELKNGHINWKPLANMSDEIKEFFVNGNDIYLLTSKGNPQFKIIKTSLIKPDLSTAETIAEGTGEWKISDVSRSKDYLLINFSKNEVIKEPRLYNFSTGFTTVVKTALKGNTSLYALSSNDNDVELFNSGWNVPFNRYNYNIASNTIKEGLYFQHYKGEYPELSNIVYEEIDVPSHDGILVPMTVIYNKSLMKKNGLNGAVMTGYGAYGANYLGDAYFDANLLPIINRGIIMVLTHVRGGGEKGNDWHLAGKKTNKPNTWKDFNACADWLVTNKYVSPQKLTCFGGSAGGILIGRAITERPSLYKAAICKVGMLNALRTEFMPSGPTQVAEFGTVKDSVEFKALLEMDAYQQIKKGEHYPAQLIIASFKDFRVQSYIPAKFAAKMQMANDSNNPVLLFVDFEGGHYGGNELDKVFVEMARDWGFILWQMGYVDFQPISNSNK